jgi:hypothetical protein
MDTLGSKQTFSVTTRPFWGISTISAIKFSASSCSATKFNGGELDPFCWEKRWRWRWIQARACEMLCLELNKKSKYIFALFVEFFVFFFCF